MTFNLLEANGPTFLVEMWFQMGPKNGSLEQMGLGSPRKHGSLNITKI